MYKQQSGFTLVEIAIVLVIIGLLLGGVLKGQEMIANGKYKNLRSDISSYSAAFYSFQDRYRALPGDMSQALAQARLNPAATGGNGNGQVQGNINNGCTGNNVEACRMWQHLRYANLIPGDPSVAGVTANPAHAYGAMVRGILFQTYGGRTGHWIVLQNLTPDVGQRLDIDLDDGTANGGTVFCNTGCTGAAYPTTGVVTVMVMI